MRVRAAELHCAQIWAKVWREAERENIREEKKEERVRNRREVRQMNRRFAIEKGINISKDKSLMSSDDERLTEESGEEEEEEEKEEEEKEAAHEHYGPEEHIEEALIIEVDEYDEYIVDEQCNIVHNEKVALRRGSIEMPSIGRRYHAFETRTSREQMPISFPGWTWLMPLTRIWIRRVAFCWGLVSCSKEKVQRIRFPGWHYIRKEASMESTDMES
jgi:hypothetical protein